MSIGESHEPLLQVFPKQPPGADGEVDCRHLCLTCTGSNYVVDVLI